MTKFYVQDGGAYAFEVYGRNERDARANYRAQWYPDRERLPRGLSFWRA